MKVFQRFPEEFTIEMRVNLGRCNAFMPQHFLHGTEIGSSFHQVRGE
jgi:hypothetical protein